MDRKTLTLTNGLLLSEHHEIVQSVINESVKYDGLIIDGFDKLFDDSMEKSDTFENFWTKLGESVVILALRYEDKATVDIFSFFTKLRELHIETTDDLKPDLAEVCHKNNQLDTVVLADHVIVIDSKKWEIGKKFIDVLDHCKSLKTLVFGCKVPLEANIINQVFSEMNYNYLGRDEVIFDCNPLPCWDNYSIYYWVVAKIEMTLTMNEETSKVCIKPLEIEENFNTQCKDDCFIEHEVFRSESVSKFTFSYAVKPRYRKYLRSCFDSFPSIQVLYRDNATNLVNHNDQVLVDLIFTRLKYLYDCFLRLSTSIINWPSSPEMKRFEVVFETSSYDSFERFLRSFPNVRWLRVEVNRGITCDDCIKLISKHLKGLIYLFVMCEESQLTSVGLKMFENSFPALKHLYINSPESTSHIQKLFGKLPKLEKIVCGKRTLVRHHHVEETKTGKIANETKNGNLPRQLLEQILSYLAKEDQLNLNLALEADIHDLPMEILEQIFSTLDKKDRLQCRQVSKRWFNIFSSSSKLDRTLNLKESYLSRNINPVKVLLDTKFKYNRIVIEKDTNFASDEDLSEFWQKIGKDIEEICLRGQRLTLVDAFKTGLIAAHLPKLKRITVDLFFYFSKLLSQDLPEWRLLLKRLKTIIFTSTGFINCFTLHLEPIPVFEMTHLEQIEVYYNVAAVLGYLLDCLSLPNLKKFIIFSNSETTIQTLFKANCNFDKLTTLFIAKYEEWQSHDFELICQKCSNLRSLGICMLSRVAHSDRTFNVSSYNLIVGRMFIRLLYLCEIYFTKFINNKKGTIEQHKLYLRTGTKSFTESDKSHRYFDELCMYFHSRDLNNLDVFTKKLDFGRRLNQLTYDGPPK